MAGYLIEERRIWPIRIASPRGQCSKYIYNLEGKAFSDEGKPYQSPGRMTHSSYYIAPVGDRTHDLPHTVASNMVNVSQSPNHSATAAVLCANYIDRAGNIRFVYAHTFLTFRSNWSRDITHPINGLDSSCKPHVTRAYQSVVWKILEWKHFSHVISSTGITVWTFLRAGKLYITDRRGPSTNVSYFHYRSGLAFTRTHKHPHAPNHTSNPRFRPVDKS